MKQNKDASFLVRLPQEQLDTFNRIVDKQAINRSALVRKWVAEYIEKHEKVLR